MKRYNIFAFLLVIAFACSATRCSGSDPGNGDGPPPEAKAWDKWAVGKSYSVLAPASDMLAVASSGMAYVEVTVHPIKDNNTEDRRKAINTFKGNADSYKVKVWSVHLPYGSDYDISDPNETKRRNCIAQLKEFIELAADLKPAKYILHPSYETGGTGAERTGRIENCIASINEVNEAVRAVGAQLLIEDLPRNCLGNRSAEMLAILDGADDSVNVCFDTNHMLTETPLFFARTVGSRIKSLHVSDYDGVDEKHWMPGTQGGIINWPELIKAIADTGYDGVFMFESSGSPAKLMEWWTATKRELNIIYK